MEYQKKTLDDLKNDEISEKREKWDCTLKDLEYGKKTEKSQKMGITLFT